MSNINLYQSGPEKISSTRRTSLFDGGFFFSIGIFVLVLIMLGASKYTNLSLKSKHDDLQGKLAAETAAFSGADLDRIIDFDVRVGVAEKNIMERPDELKVLSAIEESMVQGVTAEKISYKNENNSVKVVANLLADNFLSSARQILAFKESGKFSNVSVEDISRAEGDVSLSIGAIYKNN